MQSCVILTGSIACGKSSVCAILKQKGYKVLDADILAKEALIERKKEIIELFNCADKNGEIDKIKLANLIFNDETKKRTLENIIHPEVFRKITEQAKELEKENKIYFVDIPLFFETGSRYKALAVVVVYASKQTQLKRLITRNSFSIAQANLRINAQIDIETKKNMADFIIDNEGAMDELPNKIDNLLEKLNDLQKTKR